ncbi:glycerate kinase [Anaeramoeba ignava]|uniref:Glycerate kinase n=1 Tax=Anaeramoeba ignava TaxID=1746090 RepID=A0A9Q0L7D3_ANAIG|nr:glycerate kinase [Anaeramoeba ignava]
MNILTAFSTFKDSLNAEKVGEAIIKTLKQILPKETKFTNLPLSDGGENFIEALKTCLELETIEVPVIGPLGTPMMSSYGSSKKEKGLAIIEMAKASGIEHVPEKDRNPLLTTTYGTGQLIRRAIVDQHDRLLVAIGGSATNDAGLGALSALGYKFSFDPHFAPEEEHFLSGGDLVKIRDISKPKHLITDEIKMDLACDVVNPFTGPNGAVEIFSFQKGAKTEQMRRQLEDGMCNVRDIFRRKFHVDLDAIQGSGAAGGLGGGLYVGCSAKIKSGIEILAGIVQLEKHVANSSVVFTGEGCYDSQTKYGKVVSYVQTLCKKYNVPLVVLCGKSLVKNNINDERFFQVHSLDSMFVKDQSMKKPEFCLKKLVLDRACFFPVIGKKINKDKI